MFEVLNSCVLSPDRAHRIGQRSDVSVFRLCTNSPVEEKILSRASEKLNTAALVVEAGKFNKGSVESDNSLERKQLMEILLTDFDNFNAPAGPKGPSEKSGSDAGDDDDDASAASEKEDLNELLSNNEKDYALYAEHDERRVRNGIPLVELYVSPEDVPDWIKYPGGKGKQQRNGQQDGQGDGSRKRKAVAYDDGLTEKQFIRLMQVALCLCSPLLQCDPLNPSVSHRVHFVNDFAGRSKRLKRKSSKAIERGPEKGPRTAPKPGQSRTTRMRHLVMAAAVLLVPLEPN